MTSIADDVIAPVMHSIGYQCESGTLDISEEHRATHLCVSALHEIRSAILDRAASAGKPSAVGGAPENDPYILPSLLAEMILLENGWNVTNLGPHTPMSAFSTAVRRWRPSLVWLSVSHLASRGRFVHDFTAFCHTVRRQNPSILLGGRALTPDLQTKLPCGTFGTRMAHLSQLARSLDHRDRSREGGKG